MSLTPLPFFRCRAAALVGVVALATSWSGSAWAQDTIYRCGNTYTNRIPEDQGNRCVRVVGGNVTVVQGLRGAGATQAPKPTGPSSAPASATRQADAQQRARDVDARAIIESELQKTLARRDALRREFNNGAPDKTPDDQRDPQRYQARVAQLRDSLARTESDVAGLQRELARLPARAASQP